MSEIAKKLVISKYFKYIINFSVCLAQKHEKMAISTISVSFWCFKMKKSWKCKYFLFFGQFSGNFTCTPPLFPKVKANFQWLVGDLRRPVGLNYSKIPPNDLFWSIDARCAPRGQTDKSLILKNSKNGRKMPFFAFFSRFLPCWLWPVFLHFQTLCPP